MRACVCLCVTTLRHSCGVCIILTYTKYFNLRHMMFKGQHICDEIIFLFILNDSCTSVKVFNDTIVQVPGSDSWANLVVSVFRFR